MLTKHKQAILVVVCAALGFAVLALYYRGRLREAKHSEMDAVIAQAGQLVAIHRFLSRDEQHYRQLQFIGVLASQADEKVRANKDYIVRILPPESIDSFHEMASELHELATHAVPSQSDQEAEQPGTGQPATRPESKSEGGDKPQPDAEERSR